MLKLKDAKEELSKKCYAEIQEETAWKWASRAAASYENVLTEPQVGKIGVFLMAEEYYHEAIEHAALVDVGAKRLVAEVQQAVHPYANKAYEDVESSFGVEL
jgi:hypothetical protein